MKGKRSGKHVKRDENQHKTFVIKNTNKYQSTLEKGADEKRKGKKEQVCGLPIKSPFPWIDEPTNKN